MPAPPKKNETKEHFISRAIPFLIKEGYKQAQASAIAFSMWRDKKKKKKKK